MELSTSSISNEIDKSIQEEFSVSQAAIEELRNDALNKLLNYGMNENI